MSNQTVTCGKCEDEGIIVWVVPTTLENPEGIDYRYCDCKIGEERDSVDQNDGFDAWDRTQD
jgi:hypothetical protein